MYIVICLKNSDQVSHFGLRWKKKRVKVEGESWSNKDEESEQKIFFFFFFPLITLFPFFVFCVKKINSTPCSQPYKEVKKYQRKMRPQSSELKENKKLKHRKRSHRDLNSGYWIQSPMSWPLDHGTISLLTFTYKIIYWKIKQ